MSGAEVAQLNSAEINPDGWWSSYKWTPLVAGRYYFFANVKLTGATSFWVSLQKNGTDFAVAYKPNIDTGEPGLAVVGGIVSANGSTDYFETYVSAGAATLKVGSVFGGFRISN
jgi:hypothetical protein